MSEQLQILDLAFTGTDSVDPPQFDPSVLEYTVRRSVGQQLAVHVLTNLLPQSGPTNKQFKGFSLFKEGVEYDYCDVGWKGSTPIQFQNRDPDTANTLKLCYGDVSVRIGASTQEPGLNSFSYSIKVIAPVLTADQRAACLHPRIYDSEGEVWGGASGSCIVEVNVICSECGHEVRSYHDYRN